MNFHTLCDWECQAYDAGALELMLKLVDSSVATWNSEVHVATRLSLDEQHNCSFLFLAYLKKEKAAECFSDLFGDARRESCRCERKTRKDECISKTNSDGLQPSDGRQEYQTNTRA